MTGAQHDNAAITLNVLPALEERVIDWLIDGGFAAGFTSNAAFGHSASHGELSAAEQVSGRQRRIEFRVELPRAALDRFVTALIARFGGSDLYYYVVPVLRSGHLRRPSNE